MSRGALYVSRSPRRKIVFHKWPRGCTAKPSRNKCFELEEFRFWAAVADCVIYGPVRNEKFARISVVQVCTHSPFGSWSSIQLLIIAKRSLISPPNPIKSIDFFENNNANDLWCLLSIWRDVFHVKGKRHPANDDSATFAPPIDRFPSYFNYLNEHLIRWSNE